MLQIIKRFLLNPVFVYIVIFILECIPIKVAFVFDELPKDGDNFKNSTSAAVFYYSNNGKYAYPSEECYFELGNPPWSATYEQGGVKTVSDKIEALIPFKGFMCDKDVVAKAPSVDHSFTEKYLTFNYFLGNFSTFSHVFFYMLFAFSLLLYLPNFKISYWYTFGLCFMGGGLLELIQHFFIEGRNASFDDMLMNTLGSFIAIVFYYFLEKKFLF
jgi:VanZ family protein